VASNNSANQQIADATTPHLVNLLRIEASLREDVLPDLKGLEGNLIAEVAQLPETPVMAFRASRMNPLKVAASKCERDVRLT
jgi:hypothetical protein